MVNNTGLAQQINHVTGTFYNDQGQALPNQNDTYDYWPVEIVPPGGQIPIELTAFDLPGAGKVDLGVVAQPSNHKPYQDFEITDAATANRAGIFCITGKLHNPGQPLQDYLAVVAVLYNDQDQIINFDSDEAISLADIANDRSFDLEVCVDPLGQPVARYELQAFGQ